MLLIALMALPGTGSANTTGLGDENAAMFRSTYFQALHTKIVRYIVPYDAADVLVDRNLATGWIRAAEAQHFRILIAFYHSRVSATRMPSVSKYEREVKRFIALFPEISEYQAWNEANRGNVAHLFSSPSAKQAAAYYVALRHVAGSGRTVVGLDVLDSTNINATLSYIKSFKRYVGKRLPTVWGLHNYSDTNRFRDKGTKAVLANVPGQVWLTETGGIVKFGKSFPNKRGSGLRRAAKALQYMFRLARSNSRLTRLYIFQWTGGSSIERFDAGITNPNGTPRCGYYVVKVELTHSGRVPKC
jgi:hypothetical protein